MVGPFQPDRNLDVAVANGSSNDVSVLLGGNGEFQFHRTFDTGGIHMPPSAINNDSRIDAVVANTGSNSVGICRETNSSLQPQQTVAVGAGVARWVI